MHIVFVAFCLLLSADLVCSYVKIVRFAPNVAISAKKNKRKSLTAEVEELEQKNNRLIPEGDENVLAATESSNTKSIDDNTRAKLKAEIASPFRKLRQFVYVAAGLAGALGTVTSIPQLILAIQGSTEKGSITDIGINIAIDIGAIIGGVILWDREASAEKTKIDMFSQKEQQMSAKLSKEETNERELFLSRLPVEIQVSESNENVTRIYPLGDLQSQGKQNVIIVTGNSAFVKDALVSARIEGSNLFTAKETYVIPVVYQDEQLESADSNKGFRSKETMMSAPYIGKPTQIPVWLTFLKQEVELAEKQGAKNVVSQGLVLAVKQNGKVIRRGLGLPPWKEVCEDLTKKI